jgi:hypothetical protein
MGILESDTQKQLRDLTRKFGVKEMLPWIDQDEKDERFRPEWIRSLGELGLTGVSVAEEFGGAGLGYSDYIVVLEELARVSAGYAISLAVTGLPQMILSRFGSREQKEKWIRPLAEGRAIGAFSLSEAGSGSDAGSLRTTAKRDGNSYVLNGTKHWVTQGDSADVVLVMARTGEAGPSGISTFILEKGTPGFHLGKREKKMGCNVSHTMEIVLDQVRIPVENRVGAEGEGFKIAMTALESGRITISAAALGVARSALEVAVNHARHREQFGKPIGEFQGVSFLLADMAVQWEAARGLVDRAALLRDQNQAFTQEASMAKLFATDMAMKVTTDAVQVLGGSGYTQDFPVERWMREAKVLQIVEGTNQIQRIIIGKNLLSRKN